MTDKPSTDSNANASVEHLQAAWHGSNENAPRLVAYVVPGRAPEFTGPTEAEKLAFRAAKSPCLTEMLGTWPGDVDDGFEDWVRARRRAARVKQWSPL